MSKYDYDMIVIGGGAGGLTASTFAAQSSAKTLLVEKEKKLGGDCLHYGCVPSKSLIKSASAAHMIRNAEKYGLPAVAAAPVDFRDIARRIQGIVAVIQKHDEPEYLRQKYNVETRFGAPQFLDEHTIELNGEKITSRYFVIATGSSPFVPPVQGLQDVPFLTNVGIFSLEKLPESLAVIGAGPIGMEMAQAFGRLGSQVTVIETSDRILPREDRDVSDYVRGLLEKEGITFKLDAKVVKAERAGAAVRLTLEKKGEKEFLNAGTLLVAAGRRANVEGLGLEKAGIAVDRVIRVSEKMRTSKKHIYAVGDVTGGYQFTHVASYEAVVAVMNAILKIPKKADYRNIPWCTYLDPEVASIGYNEQRAREAGIPCRKHIEEFSRNDRALAEGETNGFLKILLDNKDRVIGVQMIAAHAGELIAEWIPVLNGKRKLSALTEAVHPYPTLSEINKNASVGYVVSTIPPWTRKLTKLLFRYQGNYADQGKA